MSQGAKGERKRDEEDVASGEGERSPRGEEKLRRAKREGREEGKRSKKVMEERRKKRAK